MKILITGGCGFVGSNLSIYLKNNIQGSRVFVVDNFFRAGSKFNKKRLVDEGIKVFNGDIRSEKTLNKIPKFDFLIDCAADPSALSGIKNGLTYLVETNINGTLNCLNLAKKFKAKIIFISSSRVYSHETINNINFKIKNKEFCPISKHKGFLSSKGISENFDTEGLKTFYGYTKLSAENLIREYSSVFGLDYIINRSGVIAGPWQWGRVDQGFLSYWLMAYKFKKKLKYIGFGGNGYQVRDILNVLDLCELIEYQLVNFKNFSCEIFNVGGGKKNKISLLNLTNFCKDSLNSNYTPTKSSEQRPGDIPYYVSDFSKINKKIKWYPKKSVNDTLVEIYDWINKHKLKLKKLI